MPIPRAQIPARGAILGTVRMLRPAACARRRQSLLPLLVAACACQSYVAVPVQPATLVAVQQHSQVRVTTKADILFVVDDSLSMSQKQDRLPHGGGDFPAALDAPPAAGGLP